MSQLNPRIVSPVTGSKAPAAIAVPEALTTGQTLVRSVRIRGARPARAANTGSVWIGFDKANDSQLEELTPGTVITLTAPDGYFLDLGRIWVDSVNLGDGVTFTGFI